MTAARAEIPLGSGQRLNTNLGKFLRIDVDVPFAQKYAHSADQPVRGRQHALQPQPRRPPAPTTGVRCAEIYALGLRNPWRWSFDTASGELWAGDVGQGLYEEVDRIVLGGNYGWNTREGMHCYSPSTGCSTAGFIDPVVEYDRTRRQLDHRRLRVPGHRHPHAGGQVHLR